MKKGTLTRDQVVEIMGVEAVKRLDKMSCDFTNRVGYNGSCQGDAEVEFAASISATDKTGCDAILTAYYYQDAVSVDKHDLGDLDWQVHGYAID